MNVELSLSVGDGKVMVEVKQTSDQFQSEQTEGVLQVNSPVVSHWLASESLNVTNELCLSGQ